jgi:hypothetical protein
MKSEFRLWQFCVKYAQIHKLIYMWNVKNHDVSVTPFSPYCQILQNNQYAVVG